MMEEDVTSKRATRRLRDRKNPKFYTDDWALGEDEIDGYHSFPLEEKLESDQFNHSFVKKMNGSDLTIAYFQEHGFNTPLLFDDKAGLDLRLPSPNFTVNDVRMCVGSRRLIDVVDVTTQKNIEMSMKDWQKYYESTSKDRLLNVISLEFSHTKLENYVQTPKVVRLLDWVDCVWPRHFKEAQIEATNVVDEMKYPKVQKYVLMSVKGCYTDFHIDFGGTSVWYHILRGSKIFWLIPPTEDNLVLYEKWVLSGKQGDVFFGDIVKKCGRVTLATGSTFFIPSGWIHAVYTPLDSLVFGGNFLHSFGIEMQLRIAQIEEKTHVPQKFRYPFFTEMLWYGLERYVYNCLGVSHLCNEDYYDEDVSVKVEPQKTETELNVNLTQLEVSGIKGIVIYLFSLPYNKRSVPELIQNPASLIKEVKILLEKHRPDSHKLSITGKAVLPPLADISDADIPKRKMSSAPVGRPPGQKRKRDSDLKQKKVKQPKPVGVRRRRVRCRKCEPCLRSDCGECSHCADMVKYGGPGRMKQTCVMRKCLQPMFSPTSTCTVCGLNGWWEKPVLLTAKMSEQTAPSALMECVLCHEITHPNCWKKLYPDVEGVVNEDLPNSWECSKCTKHVKREGVSKEEDVKREIEDDDVDDVKEEEIEVEYVLKEDMEDMDLVGEVEDYNKPHSSSTYHRATNINSRPSYSQDVEYVFKDQVEDSDFEEYQSATNINSRPSYSQDVEYVFKDQMDDIDFVNEEYDEPHSSAYHSISNISRRSTHSKENGQD
uniref:[histone H3]-dimethyl-L-lysine(36) demethylase n=1 Tax=Timema genevievae TaxID=629358 RepID=A0A7R9JX08_TIMGE|nr:unnamed protein product [Timema genevievae]